MKKQSAIHMKSPKQPYANRGVQFRAVAQHVCNSGHIYCRLREIGANKAKAMMLSSFCERLTRRFLYRPALEL